jgi:hypothetical protein
LATGSGRTEFAHVTVAQNLATLGGGVVVSWDAELVLRNVIVQWNNAMGDANVHNEGTFFAYDSLLPGAWPGSGCIDGDPRFVDVAPGGFRLRSDSPCIDAAGYLAYPPGSVDVAGLPRVLDGDYDYAPWPDMGAREYHPLLADTDGDGMADGWEYWRFLDLLDATDARLDFDDDGCDNGGEYAADTNPWNAASCLRIAAISTSSGVEVGVPATSASRRYALERCVRLGEPWTPVDGQADVVGTGEAPVLRDAATPTGGCYRVRAFTLPPAP